MDKRKIHVFLGAPTLPPRGVAGPDKDSSPWRTLELCLQDERLRAKTLEQGCRGSGTDIGGRKGHVVLADEGPGPNAALSSNACTTGGEQEVAVQTDPAPVERPPLPKNQPISGEPEFCPGVVREFLDTCFPAPGPGAAPGRAEPVSMQTEYLSMWTVSQALRLKGRLGARGDLGEAGRPPTAPDPSPTASGSTTPSGLGSPVGVPGAKEGLSIQEGSQELFGLLSERQEEGGVVLEATPDGILCSQGNPIGGLNQEDFQKSTTTSNSPSRTSSVPPAKKMCKIFPNQMELDWRGSAAGLVQPIPTTLLSRCSTKGMHYSVLVAVVHPCHLKEIRVKSGVWAGSTIPLATIVVTDQSGVEMKVVLWRISAFWALTVYPGDVLFITGVTVNEDKWRGELVLQSSHASKLLNLGQLTTTRLPPVPRNVNGQTLRELCIHLRETRPLLSTLPPRVPQDPLAAPYVRLRALQPDTLINVLLRVLHTSKVTAWRAEAGSFSRTGGVQKLVLSVEQGDGQQGELVLWGTAMAWLPRIQRHKDAVWDFRVLLVKQNAMSGLLELHSTPWGSCEPLFPDDTRALEFHSWGRGPASFAIDLQTLLSQKYTGDVELKCQITAFQFQSSPSQEASPLMNGDTPLEGILAAVSGDVTFTGCGRCGAELTTDDNGIYRPCYPCLPLTGIRRYYRPAVLTARERGSEICVQAPPVIVQKILLNVPPEKLSKAIAPSSDVRYVQVVAEAIHSMLSAPQPNYTLTVHSHFQCDENSVSTVQDFLLLDFDPPPTNKRS